MIPKPPLHNISWVMDHLESDRRFVWSRWGDGEWRCALDPKKHGNANGTEFTSEMRLCLMDALVHNKPYYWSTSHPLKGRVEKLVSEFLPTVEERDWHHVGLFGKASRRGELKPFFQWCRRHSVHYIGPRHVTDKAEMLFGRAERASMWLQSSTIGTANAYTVHGSRWVKKCMAPWLRQWRIPMVIISAGVSANIWLDQLYDLTDCHIIDIGSVLDPYCGVLSRGIYKQPRFTPEKLREMNLP